MFFDYGILLLIGSSWKFVQNVDSDSVRSLQAEIIILILSRKQMFLRGIVLIFHGLKREKWINYCCMNGKVYSTCWSRLSRSNYLMKAISKSYWTLGINPWTIFQVLYVSFAFFFAFGLVMTDGLLVYLFWEMLFGLLILKIILLLSFLRKFEINEQAVLSITSLFKSKKIDVRGKPKTYWSYRGRGVEGYDSTEYGRDSQMLDILIFLEIEKVDGDKELLYETIKMGTKFPNNHPYEPKFTDTKKATHIYDIDKFLKFYQRFEKYLN